MAIVGSDIRIRLSSLDYHYGDRSFGPHSVVSANRNCYPVKIQNKIWVTNTVISTITPFDVTTNTPTGSTSKAYPPLPTGICFDGRFAWSCFSTGAIARVDLVSGTTIESGTVAATLQGITHDGRNFYSYNSGTGNIECYDGKSFTLKRSFTAPANTVDLHFVGGRLFIFTGAASGSGVIRKYHPYTGTEESNITVNTYAATEAPLGITGETYCEDELDEDWDDDDWTKFLWITEKFDNGI